MGGGQANSGQASTAAAQQTAANTQDMTLSKQYGGQEQAIFNKLFGANGGGGGTLSGMMDPSSLNTGSPTGAYKTAYNNSSNQLNQSYNQQRGSLAQSWANAGMGSNNTPSGFQADQMRKLNNSQADSQGGLYAGTVAQQHSDALNNFWNANNIAAGQQAQATGGSTSGAGNAGSSSAAIYGTAGAYHPPAAATIAGSALQAGGQVGAAAMCPASGSLVLLADGRKLKIEDLRKGDVLRSIDGSVTALLADPVPGKQAVLNIHTKDFHGRVSATHWFDRPKCGYVLAIDAAGKKLRTMTGDQLVSEVTASGESLCWELTLDESHSYNVDGFWSLG